MDGCVVHPARRKHRGLRQRRHREHDDDDANLRHTHIHPANGDATPTHDRDSHHDSACAADSDSGAFYIWVWAGEARTYFDTATTAGTHLYTTPASGAYRDTATTPHALPGGELQSLGL